MASSDFEVTMKKAEVVAATLPMQDHWLSLSNLDLLLPPLDYGVFLCYKKQKNAEKMISCCMHDHDHDHDDNDNKVNAIKNSLAQALVCFYPFAGEVLQNRHGEPELLCNNHGVDFVHAYTDIELKDLDLYRPELSIQGKLVPIKKKHGVLSVQVTKLKCGSLVVGCTFDHRVADAYSANMFLIAWAEMAQSKTPTYTPSFRRSMLDSRRPPIYDKSIDNMYVLLSTLPPPKQPKPGDDDQLISRIYYVKAEEIECLQSQASFHGGTRRTKLESFSAFLWKTIAEGGYDDIKRCRLGIVVDGRQRLDTRDDHKAALSMVNYFGNVLSVPYSDASVGELKKLPLNKVADMVHACIDSAANEEHFLGLIDWVELHRPQQGIVKVYCEDKDDEAAIVVSSGLRFPLSQVNFGWGVPDFVSYHFPWGGKTGYVMPMQSLSKAGDWVVYMYLFGRHFDLIEAKASHVFRPLNPDYLKITG